MIPVNGGAARIPIMATADMIHCIWEKFRQRRADKKAKKEKEREYRTDDKARLNESRAVKRYRAIPVLQVPRLDEVTVAMGSMGIEPAINFTSSFDERFSNNPHGVGCSKFFETPSPTATKGSSTSCSTPKSASTPDTNITTNDQDIPTVSRDEPQPFPPFEGPELLCWPREKRKGRASADEPIDFYFSKEQKKAYDKLLWAEKQQERLRKGKTFLLKRVPSWKS